MPNSKRRKFSVQNDAAVRSKKTQNKRQMSSSSSQKLATPLLLENKILTVSNLIIKSNDKAVDKDVTASSSNIDLFIRQQSVAIKENIEPIDVPEQSTSNSRKEEKRTYSHRARVRSSKRNISTEDEPKMISKRDVSSGSTTVQNEANLEVLDKNIASLPLVSTAVCTVSSIHPLQTDVLEVDYRSSNHSEYDMCRICHGGEQLTSELGQLISACSCRGTVGRVHVKCLERWLTESGKSKCELCGTRYITRRVHKYGVARALMMWVLSQNAKQLMVDSLGIMLMSPLAVLAAWLSGRTLAGLMIHETQVTPWPLASTFVLACMTLVCYYCWIVSAATRHALGWWLWYRSQYEVRLELDEEEI